MTVWTAVLICFWPLQVYCQLAGAQAHEVHKPVSPNALADVAEISERFVKIRLLPELMNKKEAIMSRDHPRPKTLYMSNVWGQANGEPYWHYLRIANNNRSQDTRKHWNLSGFDGIVYPVYVLKRLHSSSAGERIDSIPVPPPTANNITQTNQKTGKGLRNALQEFGEKVKLFFQRKNESKDVNESLESPGTPLHKRFDHLLIKPYGKPTRKPFSNDLKADSNDSRDFPIHTSEESDRKLEIDANGRQQEPCEIHKVLNYIVYKYCPTSKLHPKPNSVNNFWPRYSSLINKKNVKPHRKTRKSVYLYSV